MIKKQEMYLEKKEDVKEVTPSSTPSSGKYMPPALRRNTERSSECTFNQKKVMDR